MPRSKRLLTDDRSNIFVYMTGHGGDEFLKFQDSEEISAFDLADAFEQMWQKKRCAVCLVVEYDHQLISERYNEIFFMIDTCQANTMYSKFYSPNILATGSSRIRENSYSVSRRPHHSKSNVSMTLGSMRTTRMLVSPSLIVTPILSWGTWKASTRPAQQA